MEGFKCEKVKTKTQGKWDNSGMTANGKAGGLEFEVSLGYMVAYRLVWAAQLECVSKKRKENKETSQTRHLRKKQQQASQTAWTTIKNRFFTVWAVEFI